MKPGYIIQEYIDNMLLYRGHKFDVRMYVLFTSIDPLIAYLHFPGFLRVAKNKYVSPNPENMR